MTSRWTNLVLAAALAIGGVVAPDVAMAQYAGQKNSPEANWPCVQRRNPTISAPALWSATEIDDSVAKWWEFDDVAQAVRVIASRRTSMEDASKLIDKIAATSPEAKAKRLTELFVGTLEIINTERQRIMRGLERYQVKQRSLADRIEKTGDMISKLRADKPVEGVGKDKLPDLEQQLTWDTRIFDERNQSLAFVCESPLKLEERAFNLSRLIQDRL